MSNQSDDLEKLGQMVIKSLGKYLNESRNSQQPVVTLTDPDVLRSALQVKERIRRGFSGQEDIASFVDTYLKNTMHLHDPRYLGHQVALPHITSGLADLIHGIANQPMSIFEMGPGANTIEHEVLDWMLDKVGWPSGGGVLTHGGSIANLHCLLTARAKVAPASWSQGNDSNLVVLAPSASHYSIARAIGIMGLGQDAIVPIPTHSNEVMQVDQLPGLINQVRKNGQTIMAVVANACATGSGLYDPIDEIAEACKEHQLWLHLDSPHGITAVLSDRYKKHLRGVDKADSLIWDAHKMMRTSTLCTAVLVKDRDAFRKTFQQEASYLFHEKDTARLDQLPYQIECTKSGLGPKLFWVLASEGEAGMARFFERVCDIALEAYEVIKTRPGFTVAFAPQSNIVCFQYRNEQFDQLKLRELLVADGQYYISSTEIKGVRFLRLVVMNDLTTLDTINGLLDRIEQLAV